MDVRAEPKETACAGCCARTVGHAHWCWGSVLAFLALICAPLAARGIILIEPGHGLKLIADSIAPIDPSQVILGTNNGAGGLPSTGIESITVDDATGLIYVQVIDFPGACPSMTTAIYEINPVTGVTIVINGATGFGICARGSDIDIANIPGATKMLVVENANAVGSEIATVSLPGGLLGTWVLPSVFFGNSFGMQFAPGIGVVPAGEIVYVADVGGGINSAPFGGPNVLFAVPPGGGDDLYIQPDGDIIFVGDFAVGIHNYVGGLPGAPVPAALPTVDAMFLGAGLPFVFGTRATVCPNNGEGLISYSGFPGGSGVFRLNEPLTSHNLVLTTAIDEGIHDLTVGPASDGSANLSLYMTVENTTTGAHQVWEVTDACVTVPPIEKFSKWTQLPHTNQEGFDAPSNLWWNKTPDTGGQRVLADDFASRSDPAGGFCNEICLVTWKGSYVDPNFPVGNIDGFLISFFTDQPADPVNPSQPKALIVTYFIDQFEEFPSMACPPGCDGHPVVDYNADLRNACIINNPMGIAGQNECLPMPPLDTIWWISIEPVLGFFYTKDPLNFCQQIKTTNSWPNDFWGWHTTPLQFNFNDDAFLGTLSISPAPKIFTYNWLTDLHWIDVAPTPCLPQDPNASVNLSFDLHDIQFNSCWDQPACILPPIDPTSQGVDVPTAYQWSGGDLPPVNVVVADDFISDGRPITGVRWWGSYFDPQYEPPPLCGPDPTGQRCLPVTCPIAGQECLPTCVLVDGATGVLLQVLDCRCMSPNDCHVDILSGPVPTCIGACPIPGDVCISILTDNPDGTSTLCCSCQTPPPLCGPDPTAQRCLPVTCPTPGQECLPTCVLVDTFTGVLIRVLDCQCMSPNDCHVDILSGPVPACIGACPIPGDVCISTLTDNLDGTSTLCCDCQTPPPVCGPDPNAPRCLPVTCPIAGQECLPTCVLVDGATGVLLQVLDCRCMSPNDCHVDILSGPIPTCVGVCPNPADVCISTLTDNPDGTSTLCCNCQTPPPQCVRDPTGQGCAPTNCPIAGNECLPTCAIFDPFTGLSTVTNCDCIDPNTCHLIIVAGAQPQCIGGCPNPGDTCSTSVSQNADGTFTFCCNCSLPAAAIGSPDDPSIRHASLVPHEASIQPIDDSYGPHAGTARGIPPNIHQVEGWFISFHFGDPTGVTTCPPDALAGVSPTVTGLYFCPASAVRIIDTGMVDCFQHRVFQYDVQLKDCCLICTLPDPRRPNVFPAQPDAFHEVRDFDYWLDIQAVVGATFTQVAGANCQKVITNTVPSDQTPAGNFWGWHTSPAVTQPQGPLNEACVGTMLNLPPAPPFCPDYGAWVKQPWLCPPPMNRVDMAFELLTLCTCLGDMDGNSVLNGLDIQDFVDCLVGTAGPGVNCICADMDGSGALNLADVGLFISALLNKAPCP